VCDSADCDCDELFKRPYFPDGEHLDASVTEAILRPYPELWRQWQARVLEPQARAELGAGGLKRYHSPTYLKAVIREYKYLREGGDRPDPALAARCEVIVSARPELAEERRQWLSDPWQRALTAEMLGYTPVGVADYYDPHYLQREVDYANKLDDPFSRESLRSRSNELILWERKDAAAAN
jgi:hypothetical protein